MFQPDNTVHKVRNFKTWLDNLGLHILVYTCNHTAYYSVDQHVTHSHESTSNCDYK